MMNKLFKILPSQCNLQSKAIPVFLLAQLETRVWEVKVEFGLHRASRTKVYVLKYFWYQQDKN
jgi:hypothetical protein